MDKMRINVTSHDILAGIPGSCRECAVARALKRRLPGHRVQVGSHTADVQRGNAYNTFYMPRIAAEFIRKFDRARSAKMRARLKPVSFWIEPRE